MKRSTFSIALLSMTFIGMIACSSGAKSDSENEQQTEESQNEPQEDYSNMREVDLSEYGIMGTIQLPKADKGKLEIKETSWGSVEVKVGDRFGLEIVPFGLTIAEKKAELENGTVYEVDILEDEDDFIFYKKYIPNSEVLEEYHFFLNKQIQEDIYEIKSMADMELKEGAVREILRSAKSFKAKPAA